MQNYQFFVASALVVVLFTTGFFCILHSRGEEVYKMDGWIWGWRVVVEGGDGNGAGQGKERGI